MSLRQYLSANNNSFFFIIYSSIAAFLTYTSMYAVRKAFAAGTFEGVHYYGIDYKVLLVTAQTIGYTLSKWIGIRIVAENTAKQRPYYIIFLILAAIFSLGLFAVIPAPYNVICFLLNGLPIGMIFGLVFNYLEGRRSTEILVTGLTVTQIFSSGFVKSAGRYFIVHLGVRESLMPFAVGVTFLPILLLSVYLLEQLPPQSPQDIQLKSLRTPIQPDERYTFIRKYVKGILIFLFSYVLMTAYRDFRDNFAAEIWHGLGFKGQSSLFTLTEIPAALVLLLVMTGLQRVRNNLLSFKVLHWLGIGGGLIILTSTLLFNLQIITPVFWITATGLGLYVAYVPANSIFFERMIALFREKGNAGFMVIMADFYGYLGSLGMLFYKNFSGEQISYDRFFIYGSYLVAILLIICQYWSLHYFTAKEKQTKLMERHKTAVSALQL